MKLLNDYGMRLGFVGIVAAIVLRGGNAKADFTFGTPTKLGPIVNSSYTDATSSISADGLSLYFGSTRPGGYGGWDLWFANRATTEDPWEEPVNLGPMVNSSVDDLYPGVSGDGLSLYFVSYRSGGSGGRDLWLTTRATTSDPWGEPANLGPVVNSSAHEMAPSISANGLELYFSGWGYVFRPGGYGNADIWVTTRPTKDALWGEPVNLGPVVNSSYAERQPNISADGLWLFFQSNRTGGFGQGDIWMTTRPTPEGDWGPPVNLGPIVNSSDAEEASSISSDGTTLLYRNYNKGDIYQVPITPIVDFNGDGIVDAADMGIIVDHWGENHSLCDIGPMPWGDGIVDVEDLKVLAEHLFEAVNDPTLIAHWPLDEAQGVIAYDNAADRDGTLTGGPVWQPDGGVVAGALQFDGIDDYVSSDPVLNPTDGKFSVVAWIKGGAPGQAVLSQADGASWLSTDSGEGNLMTELTNSGRSSVGPMLSQANITDGEWHRIGFVWDGSYRYLYVDGAEVANDAAPLSDLESAGGGLYFGAGTTLAPGTFFSGLIDDIRIYNRAVSP